MNSFSLIQRQALPSLGAALIIGCSVVVHPPSTACTRPFLIDVEV